MKFIHIYFRIETGYKWGIGMEEERIKNFDDEITKMFSRIGFKDQRDRPEACPQLYRGDEKLYVHPMDISGYLKEENIDVIKNMLMNGRSFKLLDVDVYETVLKLTNEEYINMIEENKDKYINEVLELYKTRRKNLYKPDFILNQIKSNIFTLPDKAYQSSNNKEEIFRQWLNNQVQNLIKKGLLKEAKIKTGRGLRTATTKELKVLNIAI